MNQTPRSTWHPPVGNRVTFREQSKVRQRTSDVRRRTRVEARAVHGAVPACVRGVSSQLSHTGPTRQLDRHTRVCSAKGKPKRPTPYTPLTPPAPVRRGSGNLGTWRFSLISPPGLGASARPRASGVGCCAQLPCRYNCTRPTQKPCVAQARTALRVRGSYGLLLRRTRTFK